MSCAGITPDKSVRVQSSSTSAWTYAATSDWLPAIGVDWLKAVLMMRQATNLTAHVAYQVAPVRTDKPDAWVTGFDADITANGARTTGIRTISGATGPAFFVRFGVAYKATSGSFAEGEMLMQSSFERCGRIVGQRTLEMELGTSSTYDEPFTEWIPTINANRAKFAVVMTGVSHLQCLPIFQTATASQDAPGAWAALPGATQIKPPSGTVHETCTGELVPTGLYSATWVRFGLRFSADTGSSATGITTAVVAARS
ncbi:MAG: hypothetical protein WC538_21200 [Thermoanaerobaculia bacterium]|jgi:hypothetical protein